MRPLLSPLASLHSRTSTPIHTSPHLHRLSHLDLEGTSVSTAALQEAAPHRRARAAAASALAALSRLRSAESRRLDEVSEANRLTSPHLTSTPNEALVQLVEEERPVLRQYKYDAATFLSLRSSPFAQLPTRPLPAVPGVVLPWT